MKGKSGVSVFILLCKFLVMSTERVAGFWNLSWNVSNKYRLQIVPGKQNINWMFMRLGLCAQGVYTDCQRCSMVKETWATCLQALTSTKPDAGTESWTEEQWDGCTAPQEHSAHLQAAVDCNPTAPLSEEGCLQSKLHDLLEGEETEDPWCPTICPSSQTHTMDRFGTNWPKDAPRTHPKPSFSQVQGGHGL